MKNNIFFYYRLSPVKIIKNDLYYYFEINNDIYYFFEVKQPLKYIAEIVDLTSTITSNEFMVIVYNIDNKALSYVNNNYYILLKQSKNQKFSESSIYMPLYYNNLLINIKYLNHSNWDRLWSNKVDYFEYQKDFIKSKYKLLYKTIDYYIGLCENAISYYNASNIYLNKDIDDNLVISRKRINLDDFSFYNPLNIVIDNKARDSGEYLKYLFINDSYSYSYIEEFLTKLNYSTYQYSLLIARLLFPSYYFDIYERIVNESLNENEILKVIKRSREYEDYLKYIYNFINKKKPILKIDWLD